MENLELHSPTPAKLAQDEALGHASALADLAKESPAGTRSSEDEAVLREWHKEGHQLRDKAADLQPAPKPVYLEMHDGTLTSPEEHRELVAAGEIKPTSGPKE